MVHEDDDDVYGVLRGEIRRYESPNTLSLLSELDGE
jgi:hypothetical protein